MCQEHTDQGTRRSQDGDCDSGAVYRGEINMLSYQIMTEWLSSSKLSSHLTAE